MLHSSQSVCGGISLSLKLASPQRSTTRACVHVLVCHLTSLWGCVLSDLLHTFKSSCSFSFVKFKNSLCILDTSPVSEMCFGKIFNFYPRPWLVFSFS